MNLRSIKSRSVMLRGLTMFLFLATALACHGEEFQSVQEVLDEYRKHEPLLKKACDGLSMETLISVKKGGKLVPYKNVLYKTNGERSLVEYRFLEQDFGTVICMNPKKPFMLKEKEFRYTPILIGPPAGKRAPVIIQVAEYQVASYNLLNGYSLLDTLERKYHEVTSFSHVTLPDGHKAVELKWINIAFGKTEGTITFDLQMGWVIRKRSLRVLESGASLTHQFEYDREKTHKGIPIPSGGTWSRISQMKGYEESAWVVKKVVLDPPPDKDFELTAFGLVNDLPDSPDPEKDKKEE